MVVINKTISVNVSIDQEGMEKLIREDIAKQDADVIVDDIRFIMRRNPTKIEAEIDAHIAGFENTCNPKVEPVEETGNNQTAVQEEVQTEEATEEAQEDTETNEDEETSKKTVGSLFNQG